MQDLPRPFWDHFRDLRKTLIYSLAGWLAASAVCLQFSDRVLHWLLQPPLEKLVFTTPWEPFFAYFKLAGILGLIVSFPWILYHLWSFISVALKPGERKVFWELIPVAYGLFLGGCALSIKVVLPMAMRFLMSFSGPQLVPFITLGSYLSFIGYTSLGLGLFFQFPIVLYVLASLGIIRPESFNGYRRHVLLGLLVLAALISTGPLDQVMIAVPAYILFEATLLVLRLRRVS